MTQNFADKLMNRPIDSRWVKAKNQRTGKMLSGVLVSHDGHIGEVRPDGLKRNIKLNLNEISYR